MFESIWIVSQLNVPIYSFMSKILLEYKAEVSKENMFMWYFLPSQQQILWKNLTFSDMALTPFVPLGGGCSDNGDEVQSCISGWQNSTFTAGTASL